MGKKLAIYLDFVSSFESLQKLEIPEGAARWILITSFGGFKKFIECNGLPEYISFSYPLAEQHYSEARSQPVGFTGLDCMYWLHGYCANHDLTFPRCEIHGVVNSQELSEALKRLTS